MEKESERIIHALVLRAIHRMKDVVGFGTPSERVKRAERAFEALNALSSALNVIGYDLDGYDLRKMIESCEGYHDNSRDFYYRNLATEVVELILYR